MAAEDELFDVLKRHGVDFVIVGGHAVNVHGYGRATEDVDLVWIRSPDAEQALLAALNELNARYIGREIDPDTGLEKTHPVSLAFVRNSHLMMLLTRLGFLDLFDYVPGLPMENPRQLLDASLEVNGLRFVSLPWLRRMKEVAGRPKDLLDLEHLSD